MAGYLGYDRCALGILLGALEEVGAERLGVRGPARAASSPAARCAAEAALAVHRRSVEAVVAFAEPIGAILRSDPLGRYRSVALDPADLSLWALHRGGTWTTVTDPTAARSGWSHDFSILNAHLVGANLDADQLWDLLERDDDSVTPLVRYLSTLRSTPPAAAALLAAVGSSGLAALVAVADDAFSAFHLPGGSEHPVAARADQVLAALGGVWAVSRAAGAHRDEAWDQAALGGGLYGSARLLGVAAATPGTLSTDELAKWATATWRRLADDLGQPDLPQPELIGDLVLGAVITDGRAARRMLLQLAPPDLAMLLRNAASSPTVTGSLLLASTAHAVTVTSADQDEVRRSVQAVGRAVAHLLEGRHASFPDVGEDGRAVSPAFGLVLPIGLGVYVGRQLDHMIDPCEGAPSGSCPIRSRAWPGWQDREVADLLARLVADRTVASELHDSAWAMTYQRLSAADLTRPGSVDLVETEAFTLGALGDVVRTHGIEGALTDQERFARQVAAVDMAVTVAGLAAPGVGPIAVASGLWGPASDAAAMTGVPSLGEFALQPFKPASVRRAVARSEADEALEVAVLKGTVGALALSQLAADGALRGAPDVPQVPTEPDAQVLALAAGTRPGDNANAAGQAYGAQLDVWLTKAAGTTAGRTVDRLLAGVGDAAAAGTRWLA